MGDLDGGELFNLTPALARAMEVQVVEMLNRIPEVWDPNNHGPLCRFAGSAPTFPDVRLA